MSYQILPRVDDSVSPPLDARHCQRVTRQDELRGPPRHVPHAEVAVAAAAGHAARGQAHVRGLPGKPRDPLAVALRGGGGGREGEGAGGVSY